MRRIPSSWQVCWTLLQPLDIDRSLPLTSTQSQPNKSSGLMPQQRCRLSIVAKSLKTVRITVHKQRFTISTNISESNNWCLQVYHHHHHHHLHLHLHHHHHHHQRHYHKHFEHHQHHHHHHHHHRHHHHYHHHHHHYHHHHHHHHSWLPILTKQCKTNKQRESIISYH